MRVLSHAVPSLVQLLCVLPWSLWLSVLVYRALAWHSLVCLSPVFWHLVPYLHEICT